MRVLLNFYILQQLLWPLILSSVFDECHEGDINIALYPGIIMHCPEKYAYPVTIRFYLRYLALGPHFEKLNRDPKLVYAQKNITLGYVIHDTCLKPSQAADFSMRLTPSWYASVPKQDSCSVVDPITKRRKYFVAGTVGEGSSASTIAISYIQQNYKLYTITPTASSDELSNKARHPNVMRMVPPDSYQAEVLLDMLLHFNWTYIIVLHEEDNYGRNILNNFYKILQQKKAKVCVAFEGPLTGVTENYEAYLLGNILKYPNARIVLYLGYWKNWLFKALKDSNKIIIGTDTLSYQERYATNYLGSFEIDFKTPVIPDVVDIYNSLTYEKVAKGSNIDKRFWRIMHNCEFNASKVGITDCSQFNSTVQKLSGQYISTFGNTLNAATIFAQVLSHTLSNACNWTLNSSKPLNFTLINQCLTSENYEKEFYNQEFLMTDGDTLRFNEFGHVRTVYYISQVKELDNSLATERYNKIVGNWSDIEGLIMDWSQLSFPDPDNSSRRVTYVTSKCSSECSFGEAKIVINECCWSCRKCRNNEVIRNGSSCDECPIYYWPDRETLSYCEAISPYFVQPGSLQYVCMSGFAVLGMCLTLVVMIFYFIHRNNPLIKASAYSLSILCLIGILLGFAIILLFFGEPTVYTCSVRNGLYHLASAIPFGSLLIKTNRIYRVFAASRKGNRAPKCVSNYWAVGMFAGICGIQSVIIVTMMLAYPVNPHIRMPNPYEPFIESSCPTSIAVAFWGPFGVNLFLILLCCCYAFLTRSLPDNFHDAKCIFASAAACCFIWIAFIPSLVTTTSGKAEELLVSLAVGVSSLMMLSTVFLPKIYGVTNHKEDNIQFYNSTTNTVAPSTAN